MTDIQNGKMIDPGKQSWNIKAGVFSSCMLHIIAMACMLSDHMWATLFPYVDILTCIGRIAFPIFAFMIVEGFYHTSNFRRYLCRMLIFAVISEVPFDLVSGDSVLYLFHQNVLWTFLIGLLLIALIDKVRKTGKVWLWIPVAIVVTLVGYVIGTITMVDFYGAGVVMYCGRHEAVDDDYSGTGGQTRQQAPCGGNCQSDQCYQADDAERVVFDAVPRQRAAGSV